MSFYKIKLLHDRLARELNALNMSYVAREQEAWWLLETLTEKSKSFLMAAGVMELSAEQEEQLDAWMKQRVIEKKPLQYIIGSVPFCDLTIAVRPPVLIPRAETEEMTSWIIDLIKQHNVTNLSILDLCTGSGCIVLALAKAFPLAKLVAIDCSDKAIELAQENKEGNNITNVTIIKSDLYTQLPQENQFDLIISNPPYLCQESYDFIDSQVRLWEDEGALKGGADGMKFYRKIAATASLYLKKNRGSSLPQLVFEIGIDQLDIESMLAEEGFKDIRVIYDLSGKRRWAVASI